MPRVKVNDVELNYEVQGHGQPIIFVPGLAANHVVWGNIAPYYARHYSVITLDNRGVGKSDCPDQPYTVDLMANDIIEFCKALQLSACHFVGHDMGCAILMTLANKSPSLCRSLVLSNPFLAIDVRYAEFAKARGKLFSLGAAIETLAQLTLGWFFSSNFLRNISSIDELLAAGARMPDPITEPGYRNQLHAFLAFNGTSWVHNIKVPTLVIGSDQDMIVPEPHMHQVAKMIPGARYHCIYGPGHWPHIENPEEFNNLAYNFIVNKS